MLKYLLWFSYKKYLINYVLLVLWNIEPAKIKAGSYMSAHVLLNLLNELGKSDKMRGLLGILSLFRNEFNKFNKTGAQKLYSIDHMT